MLYDKKPRFIELPFKLNLSAYNSGNDIEYLANYVFGIYRLSYYKDFKKLNLKNDIIKLFKSFDYFKYDGINESSIFSEIEDWKNYLKDKYVDLKISNNTIKLSPVSLSWTDTKEDQIRIKTGLDMYINYHLTGNEFFIGIDFR